MAFKAEYFQVGNIIDHTPSSDVAAGDVVIQGELVGIARQPILANELGALTVEGVFKFVKDASTAFAAGVNVFWDVADQEATEDDDTGTNKLIGKTVLAAADTDTILLAKLNQ